MSYLKISIGGKERGVKFNQLALEIYMQSMVEHEKMVTTNPAEWAVYATFYSGLAGCCKVKNEDPDFTFEDVINWVDEFYQDKANDELLKKVCDLFTATREYREWMESIENLIRPSVSETEEDKKKVVLPDSESTGLESTNLPLVN